MIIILAVAAMTITAQATRVHKARTTSRIQKVRGPTRCEGPNKRMGKQLGAFMGKWIGFMGEEIGGHGGGWVSECMIE